MPDKYAAQRVAFKRGDWVRTTKAFLNFEESHIRDAYPAGAWARVQGHRPDGCAIFRFKDHGVATVPYEDVRDVPMEVIVHPEQQRLDELDALCWRLFTVLQRLELDRGETWTPAHRRNVQQLLESARRVLTVDNGTPLSSATLAKRD